jgi:hypothetical protein
MASIKVLEKMNTEAKNMHRAVMAGRISNVYPNRKYPKDGLFVTLGGLYTDERGRLIQNSEIEYLVNFIKFPSKNIVCVDWDSEVVKRNNRNTDPTCKGIRNIHSPRSYTKGVPGGIVKVVMDLVMAGEKIAGISADFMSTVRCQGYAQIDMMAFLNLYQKETCLFMGNYTALDRWKGKYKVSEMLWKAKAKDLEYGKDAYVAATFKKVAKQGKWEESIPTLNNVKGFGYTGGRMPMEAIFLVKKSHRLAAKNSLVLFKDMMKKRKYRRNPNVKIDWVAAGKKAWATRQRNLKRAAKKRG